MKFEVELSEKADRDLRNIFSILRLIYTRLKLPKGKSIAYGRLCVLLTSFRNDTAAMKRGRGAIEVFYSGRDISEQLKQI